MPPAIATLASAVPGLRQKRHRLATPQTLLAFIKDASGFHQLTLVVMLN